MNAERWQRNFADHRSPTWCMDIRHARMIKAVILGEKPRSIVEIGCYKGASTAAIVEAIEEGAPVERVECVDLCITREVRELAQDPRFILHERNSAGFSARADMWVIDAAHDMASALTDLKTSMKGGAKIVVVHDSHNTTPGHEGAMEIASLVTQEANAAFADNRRREGELTERGLVIGFRPAPSAETLAALEALAQ